MLKIGGWACEAGEDISQERVGWCAGEFRPASVLLHATSSVSDVAKVWRYKLPYISKLEGIADTAVVCGYCIPGVYFVIRKVICLYSGVCLQLFKGVGLVFLFLFLASLLFVFGRDIFVFPLPPPPTAFFPLPSPPPHAPPSTHVGCSRRRPRPLMCPLAAARPGRRGPERGQRLPTSIVRQRDLHHQRRHARGVRG